MARRVVVVVCVAALALLATGRASALTTQELSLTMDDGVRLAATLYEPADAPAPTGYPAIVMLHGLGGKRQDLDAIGQGFAGSGYAVLSFDARGHGQSGGLTSIDGPREIADTRTVFDWLAARPEVDRYHIGGWGLSLGGGAVLRSLVEGVPWAAVETLQSWTDLYSALAPQNLTKSGVISGFLSSVPQDRLDPSVLALRDDALASRNLEALRDFARVRSSRQLLSNVTTPVHMFQGRRDFAFDIAQATAAIKLLNGPKRLYIGDFGHAPSKFPGPDVIPMMQASQRWFDRYLRGALNPLLAGTYALASDPWNGLIAGGDSPPPSRPAAFTLGRTATITQAGKSVRATAKTRKALEAFGSAQVQVTARLSGGWSRLVAVLTAKPPSGPEIVVSEGGVNTAGLSGRRRLTIRLLSDATLIRRGSRIRLTLASNSLAQNPGNLLYLNLPMPARAKVTLGPVRLTLPVLATPISR